MRYYRVVFFLALVACKATSTTSSIGVYKEDLSVHRPKLEVVETFKKQSELQTESHVPLRNHLKLELDSISRVSTAENRQGKRIDGFVIQIYSGNSRETATTKRALCFMHFPELEPRVTYHQPNFRVRAGRFTERLYASKIYEQVKKEFPKALLIPERFQLSNE